MSNTFEVVCRSIPDPADPARRVVQIVFSVGETGFGIVLPPLEAKRICEQIVATADTAEAQMANKH